MIHIPPAAVNQHWPRIRTGLERIQEKDPQSWDIEDVYTSLLRGDAFVALIADDGFLIWQRYAGDDKRGMLFVWCLEGKNLELHAKPVQQELVDMAKRLHCKTIRIIGRRGWGRDPFWRFAGYVYEHEV